MALLEIKDLAVGYDSRSVLNHLNFTVNEGDYLCIVGENGSGKSTLIRTILKLQDPISGEVVYGDGLTANEIGYLPQQTVVQKDFPASIREVVMSGLQGRKGIKAFYTRQDKEDANRNMERMGILDIADKCYRDLS
ncbi:MAG: ATP-binding cassette domain-containing protein, partial [Oscillospiraceae bacterium]|nr:ATP-binding cassette domain-containing protein [Oscillospiraceae bacterium]